MALTKEDKIARIEAIRERKRRILSQKPTYKPNDGQSLVHKDDKPIRIVAAANGGGKSTLAVQECLWWATGYNPILQTYNRVPATIIVLLDSPIKVQDVWLTEIRKWYPLDEECELRKNGKPYVNEILFKNGSRVSFMFHEQEDLVFEGIQLDYLIADEPFPRRIWIALTRGARKKGSKPRFLIIGTPIGQPWLYEELWKAAANKTRDDIGIHRFGIRVNEENLADGYIEQFSKNLTEAEKRVRLDGHFAHLEGLALAHLFSREVHVVREFPWPQGKPVVFIIDPHMNKPHTFALIGATGDGRVYYIKESSSKQPPKALSGVIKEFCQGYRVLDYVSDSLGETANTGGDGNKSFCEVLRDCGIPIRSTSFSDKNDEDFIQRIQQVLEIPDQEDNFGRKIPKLAIMNGNEGIIHDIETVTWLKQRNLDGFKPKLDITSKDYLSLLKYALATNIAYLADLRTLPRAKRTGRRSPWSGKKKSNGIRG